MNKQGLDNFHIGQIDEVDGIRRELQFYGTDGSNNYQIYHTYTPRDDGTYIIGKEVLRNGRPFPCFQTIVGGGTFGDGIDIRHAAILDEDEVLHSLILAMDESGKILPGLASIMRHIAERGYDWPCPPELDNMEVGQRFYRDTDDVTFIITEKGNHTLAYRIERERQ